MSATTKNTDSSKTATANRGAGRNRATNRAPEPQQGPEATKTRAEATSQIDYGPALHAIEDLIAWTFDLAQKNVAGWPQGKRRVRNAHRFVGALLRGKRPRAEPTEDLLFTAALLTRVLDADLGLGLDHVVDVLDRLGLPLDHVPFTAPMTAPAVQRPPIAPSAWRHLRAIYGELSPGERVCVRLEAEDLTAAERDGWIVALSGLTVEDGVGFVRAYLRDQIDAPPLAVTPLPTVPRTVVRSPLGAVRPRVAPAPNACGECGCPVSLFRRAA